MAEAALVFRSISPIEHDDVVKRGRPESSPELAHGNVVKHDPGGIGIHERVLGLAYGTDKENETIEKHCYETLALNRLCRERWVLDRRVTAHDVAFRRQRQMPHAGSPTAATSSLCNARERRFFCQWVFKIVRQLAGGHVLLPCQVPTGIDRGIFGVGI